MERKLKVLIITSMPWRDDNNIGNSYSNIFRGLEDRIEFAHIYCRTGMPQNSLCHKYFQIDEGQLIKNIISRKNEIGNAFELEKPMDTVNEIFSSTYNKMRIMRWEIFFIIRNVLWNFADWKTERLDQFVLDFKPDLIFGTLTYMPNINKIMIYLSKKFALPLVTYSWDDVYSLKQYSLSPFFWIRRFSQRKWIRKTVEQSATLFTITKMMQKEYSHYFNKECKLLFKGYNFDNRNPVKSPSTPVEFLFMGNLGAGRWKALSELVMVLKEVNKSNKKANLQIYTLSPVSDEMKTALEWDGTSKIMERVANDKVLKTLENADVLLHVEPLAKKDKLFYRLSFSTKLVDYFYVGRCILGLGGDTASLRYLTEQDAGIVIKDIKELKTTVERLIDNDKIILSYADKAWNCGVVNHQIDIIQDRLMDEFYCVIKKHNLLRQN